MDDVILYKLNIMRAWTILYAYYIIMRIWPARAECNFDVCNNIMHSRILDA
jgi:hypothetical protein